MRLYESRALFQIEGLLASSVELPLASSAVVVSSALAALQPKLPKEKNEVRIARATAQSCPAPREPRLLPIFPAFTLRQ